MLVVGALSGASAASAHAAGLIGRLPFKALRARHGVFFAVGMLIWTGFDQGFTGSCRVWIAGMLAFCSVEICIDRPGVMANAVASRCGGCRSAFCC